MIKSRLIGDAFIKLFLAFRVLNIQGRFGGGKTLLSVWMAYYLMSNKYVDQIVSNFPIIKKNDKNELLKRTAVILDESWMYITSRADVINYSAYLRKLDDYLILPSVFDIQSRLSFFTCSRLYNLQAFGIPGWIYRWDLNSKKSKEKGSFILTNPSRIFGLYDTGYIPFDDEGINERLAKTIDSFGLKRGCTNSFRNNDNRIDLDDYLLDIDNGVYNLDERIEEFKEIVNKAKRVR